MPDELLDARDPAEDDDGRIDQHQLGQLVLQLGEPGLVRSVPLLRRVKRRLGSAREREKGSGSGKAARTAKNSAIPSRLRSPLLARPPPVAGDPHRSSLRPLRNQSLAASKPAGALVLVDARGVSGGGGG